MALGNELTVVDGEWVKIVVGLLQAAPEPMTLAKIRAQLPPSAALPEVELEKLLTQLEIEGVVYRYAPYRSDGARYWTNPVQAYAAQVMLNELRDLPLSLAALEKKVAVRLSDCPPSQRKQIFEDLLAAGQIYQIPQQPGERAAVFRSGSPDPIAYFSPLVSDFAARARAITEQLRALNVSTEQCWAAIDELLDEELFTAGPQRGKTPAVEKDDEPPVIPDLRANVLGWMGEATKMQRRGGLISVRELRQAMAEIEPDKVAFDACILDLAQAGQVWLYRHDYAASLSPADREALVCDTKGNYYNGVSLRT